MTAGDSSYGLGVTGGMGDAAITSLVGRATELEQLDRFLRGDTTPGRAMLLRGEAGVGKSALLSEARLVAEASGVRVLTTVTGVRAESHIPFAALHRLLSPLLGHVDRLPDPQRHALLGALGEADAQPPHLLRIGLGARNLLTAAAGSARRVLVLADEMQWFDEVSRQMMFFAARRLGASPVSFLGASRLGSVDDMPGVELDDLWVGPLTPSDAQRLLTLTAPGLDATSRQFVLQWARGNPLALRELTGTAHLAYAEGGREWAPLTDRLQEAFAGPLDQLPTATRTLLLAAALDSVDRLGHVAASAATVHPGATIKAVGPAVDAGLVTVTSDTICFRHPVVRLAVFQAADRHECIELHRAHAERSLPLPEQQTWHRVAANVGPSPDLAAELEQLAARYARRGSLAQALMALEEAAELLVDDGLRGRRLLDAASVALQMGNRARVDELLRRADDVQLTGPDERRRRLLRWGTQPPSPDDDDALSEVLAAARSCAADREWDDAIDLLVIAARAARTDGREGSSGAQVITALNDVGERPDDPRCLLIRAFASPLRSGSAVIAAARRARVRDLDVEGTAMVATAAMWVHAADVAKPLLDAAEHALRRGGDHGRLRDVLFMRGWAGLVLGDWENGLVDAAEAAYLSRNSEDDVQAATLDVLSALLRGLRGDRDQFEASMCAAERVALRGGGAALLNVAQLARALMAMSDGEYETAYEQLLRLYDPDDAAHHRIHGCAWLTYLAEAAVRCGRIPDARVVLHTIEPLLAHTDAAQLHTSVAYARAVLADDATAEAGFKEALSADLARWPLDHARLQLAWGAWLRRQRRLAESREPLRRARDVFHAIGAVSWAAQATSELRAAGERSKDNPSAGPNGLTAQERTIAQLASLGLSNRQIGQRVLLSHRTVASHLHHIFPKLGVTSRRQLGGVLRGAVVVDD